MSIFDGNFLENLKTRTPVEGGFLQPEDRAAPTNVLTVTLFRWHFTYVCYTSIYCDMVLSPFIQMITADHSGLFAVNTLKMKDI